MKRRKPTRSPRVLRKLMLDVLESRYLMATLPIVDQSVILRNTTHLVSLALNQDTNGNSSINLSESEVTYAFQGSIRVEGSSFHGGVEVGLRLGGRDLGARVAPTGTTTAIFQISVASNLLSQGTNTLTLVGDRPSSTLSPFEFFSFDVSIDTVRPTSAFVPISSPINKGISDATINFSEKIDSSTLAASDVTLFRDGAVVPVAGLNITANGSNSFVIGNLANFTNLAGVYELRVNNAIVNDLSGNPGDTLTSVQWTVDLTPPGFSDPPRLDSIDDSSNGILDGTVDGITAQKNDLTYRSVVTDVASVKFELQKLVAGVFMTIVADNPSLLVNGAFITTFQTASGFSDGTYRVRAQATDASGNIASSDFTQLVIDSTKPAAPANLGLATGRTTLNDTQPTILFDIAEQGAAIELFRDGVLVGTPSRLIPINSSKTLTSIIAPLAGEGVFRYQVRQIDQAGNVGPLSSVLALAIDTTAPVIDTTPASKFRISQSDLSEPTSELPVFVTTSTQPTFLARISDQAFVDRDNLIKVELLVDGVATTITDADFSIKPTTTGFTSVSARPSVPLALKKILSIQLRVTDQAGNVATSTDGAVKVFVNQVGAPTQNAPGTPIFNEKWFIGSTVTKASTKDSFLVEVDQAIPPATKVSINSKLYEVTKSSIDVKTGNATLTLKTALLANVDANTKLMWLRSWTTTFDKTTQTTWLTMEDGVSVAQFDPTNGNIKLYNIGIRDPITGVARYGDPHGVAFDFNSHLTPRVWFVYRNENLDRDLPDFGDTTKPFDTTAHGPGTVGYLDIVSNTLWTFDIQESLFASASNPTPDLGLTGTHAIFVDTRGHVWLTSERSILEIDTSRFPDGKPTGNLSSTAGTIIVHNLPKGLGDTGTTDVPFQPHGIQVIVDDRTGTPYVFASDGDAKDGTARVILLQPGANGNSDQWKEWNFDKLLKDEASAKPEDPVPGSATLFLALDDNETPGKPEDDRLIAASPGALAKGAKGIMRVLNLSTILGPLVQSDLERLSGKSLPSIAVPTEAQVTTYRLPGTPGSSQSFASNQVPLIDRAGNVFFVDAIGGVGRFNANDPNPDFLLSKTSVKLKDFSSQANQGALSFSSTKVEPVKFTAKAIGESTTKLDRSTMTGLDQYDEAIVSTASQGGNGAGGLFRGALSAENSLYGSNSSSDSISTALFAESSRRQLAVVASPFELPKGARIGGRAALQVLRDGSVVLTARGDGDLLDVQVNLTKELLKAGKIASFDDAAVIGDMAALVNADGVIEALGRQADGRLIRYTFTPPTYPPTIPPTTAWKTDDLKNIAFWTANSKLTIPSGQLVAEDPAPTPGIGFTITTSTGHLIVIPSGGIPRDLSAAPGRPAVYSGVGSVKVGDKLRFYGTNQTGSVVEYLTDLNLGIISTHTLVLPNNVNARDTRMLRNIFPVLDGTTIHLFGTDGVSQLVHYELDSMGNVTLAENVTQGVQKTGEVYGYFNFEQSYGGRVYTYVSAIKQTDGTLRVYGTNGGELIEFTRDTSGKWRVGNLTNDISSTDGVKNSSRIPANFVFGAPSVYEDMSKERHILQINADGEIIEYYTLANDPQKRFHTQNVNLRLGDSSLITNLRYRASSLQSTASVSSNSTSSSATSAGATASLFAAPFVSSLDVNADGELSPLDVLLVINYLNAPTESNRDGDGESSGNRLDVNGDGWISPLDVLILVNHLNGESAGEGEGEGVGEASPSDTESITATALDLAFAYFGQWDSFQTIAKKQRGIQRSSR